jgi:predicted nucleotidyltransferase
MKENLLKLIEEKSPGSKPILLVIRGSHAYGTNVETSDTDYAGVFIQPIEDILGFGYKEQINDDKNDIVIYEIKRFLQLLESNNPTVLELLNTPDNCIIYKHPIFNEVLNNRDKFITKICAKSFGGYGKMQIQKAKGQNKKQNWEKDKVTRKDVLDFVYVIQGEKSIPWKVWNSNDERQFEEKFCGVVNVPNARDVYAVYYDGLSKNMFSEDVNELDRENLKRFTKESGKPMGFGYKGLVKTGEGNNVAESNALRLSSIPKGETPICNIVYNKDGYSEHCKDYKSYEDWLANKNEARWVDVKSHGQKIDGKNMMHSKRLMSMAREIAEGKGINVRRDDAEYLISIRRGEIDLQTLIDEVEKEIIEIDELFTNSNLPESVDKNFINELLIKIRKNIYNI